MRELTPTRVVIGGVMGMLGNSLFELFRHPSESDAWRQIAFSIVGIIVLAIVVSPRFRRWLNAVRELTFLIPEPKPGPRRKALVAFVSEANGRTSALQAAQYHIGVLQHLWLIASKESKNDAGWVAQQLAALQPDPPVKVHETVVIEDTLSIPEAKNKVEMVRREAKRAVGREDEIVCDFTGLNKPASAGMILACAPRTALLQYMYPNRTENGRPVYAEGSTPREIAIAYRVAEDEVDET